MKNRVVIAATWKGIVQWSRIVAAFDSEKEAIEYGDKLTLSMQGYDITVENKWHGGWVVTHRNGQEIDVQGANLPLNVNNLYEAFNGPNESPLDDEGHHVDDDPDEDDAEKDDHDTD